MTTGEMSEVPQAAPSVRDFSRGGKGAVRPLSREARARELRRSPYPALVGTLLQRASRLSVAAWDRAHPEPRVTVATVADHVEHIVRVAGHDAVGLGGDYDGIGGHGPERMRGVDGYPLLLAELARRGWSDADLGKLTSGNILRVMEAVERVADTFDTGVHSDRLPDLIVRWSDREATLLTHVVSPRFGTVTRRGHGSGRSGNHTAGDAWALVVPGASTPTTPSRAPRLVDIAATAAVLAGRDAADLPGEPLLER